ncbi:CPBP family intramembrane metalloprotease [Bacillus sp. HMF5848]|uniref:CPBP family intramembrane glutamic endopeptidase n=1 Tax=Bacillus sp. HMF5848 TaxID=2495421 RepID=UPI000F7AB120|nr:type II CAAX endopeptidase family protein [Bacillus sp. HMF5848]RSK26091.1 CPBP family intramembrane metalloprotease [Bacillus sp. HMF5848]
MQTNTISRFTSNNVLIRIVSYLLILSIGYFIISIPLNIFTSVLIKNDSLKYIGYTIEQLIPVAIIILGTGLTLRLLDKKSLKDIGFDMNSSTMFNFAKGFSVGFLIIFLIFLVEVLFNWIHIEGFAWNFNESSTLIKSYYFVILNLMSVAIVEEIFIRGYIMQNLEKSKGRLYAILVSSIVFGLLHTFSAYGTWAIYVVPLSHTLAGILLALTYYIRENLWIPIGLHFSWNFFLYKFFGLTGMPKEYSIFIATEIKGPSFWVGLPNSSFGPEVGMLGIGMITLAIIFIYRKWIVDKDNVGFESRKNSKRVPL